MADSSYWARGAASDVIPLGLHQVVPDDNNDLPENAGFRLSTADGGDITFEDAAGNVHTKTFDPGGGVNCGIKRVHATGTTATDIVVGVIG